MAPKLVAACIAGLVTRSMALNFTVSNGQIFTPGFAILDAPQPGTPLGGDIIEVALDISANGKLDMSTYGSDSPSQIYNITIFLYSYDTGRNLTITNGTATTNNASLGNIMLSESGSTVKHVKWRWPDCLVGDGQPTSLDSDRGVYNVGRPIPPASRTVGLYLWPIADLYQISIRQSFRLNGDDHYTIFDVPISVTNSIPASDDRPSCDVLNNPLLSYDEINATATNDVGILFAPGDATQVEQSGSGSGSTGGLGGAATLRWSYTAGWLASFAICAVYFL